MVLTSLLLLLLLPSSLIYLVHHILVAWVARPRNLKRAYNAQWALVTGASSGKTTLACSCLKSHSFYKCASPSLCELLHAGIGKALADKLGSQGLNVVLVALPNALLQETHAELSSKHPSVTFRSVSCMAMHPRIWPPGSMLEQHLTACTQVGADLGRTGYLPQVAQATEDIDVQIVFCNAGYMLTGFFETKCGTAEVLSWQHWPGHDPNGHSAGPWRSSSQTWSAMPQAL